MLSECYPLETLKKVLILRDTWRPFSTADERNAWAFPPEATRQKGRS